MCSTWIMVISLVYMQQEFSKMLSAGGHDRLTDRGTTGSIYSILAYFMWILTSTLFLCLRVFMSCVSKEGCEVVKLQIQDKRQKKEEWVMI